MKRAYALVVLLLLLFVGGGVAQAHSELVSSSPTDGQVLDAPPTEVTFTFNEDLLPDFVNFVATNADGDVTELVVSGINGPTAVVAWPPQAPGGQWQIDYRVVSADGHPVDGSITFSYVAESPSPTPTPSTPSPSPTTSSATPEPAPTSAEPSPSAVPASENSGPSTGWIIAIVGVGALIGIVVVGLIARRRTS